MSRNKADYTWLCCVLGLRLELYVPLTGTQLPHRSTAKIGDQMSWKGYVVSINLLRALMDTNYAPRRWTSLAWTLQTCLP